MIVKVNKEQAEFESDIFSHIKLITIAGESFTNTQLTHFKPEGFNKEETVALLKKVFQENYPTTRTNDVPKVPSSSKDKELLLAALNVHFDTRRRFIVKAKDSLSSRADLKHLQEVKLLIEYFKTGKETFPYHKFTEYLDNQEYIDAQEDMTEALHNMLTSENEDDRIRKLLRQFVKVYLTNKGENTFVLNDPGLSAQDFKELLEEAYTGKIEPSVLKELLQMLDNPLIVQGLQKDMADTKKANEAAEKERDIAISAKAAAELAKRTADDDAVKAQTAAGLASMERDVADGKAAAAEKAKQHALEAKAAAESASEDAKTRAILESERATAEANLAITAAVQAAAKATALTTAERAAKDRAIAAQTNSETEAVIAKTARETAERALAIAQSDLMTTNEQLGDANYIIGQQDVAHAATKEERNIVKAERNDAKAETNIRRAERNVARGETSAAKEELEKASKQAREAVEEAEQAKVQAARLIAAEQAISSSATASLEEKETARKEAIDARDKANTALALAKDTEKLLQEAKLGVESERNAAKGEASAAKGEAEAAKGEASAARADMDAAREDARKAREEAEEAREQASRLITAEQAISSSASASLEEKETARKEATDARDIANNALAAAKELETRLQEEKRAAESERNAAREEASTERAESGRAREEANAERQQLKNEFESLQQQRNDALDDAVEAKKHILSAHKKEEDAKKELYIAYAEIEESVAAQTIAEAQAHQAKANLLKIQAEVEGVGTERNAARADATAARGNSIAARNERNIAHGEAEQSRADASAAKGEAEKAKQEARKARDEANTAREEAKRIISAEKAISNSATASVAEKEKARDEAEKARDIANESLAIAKKAEALLRTEANTFKTERNLALGESKSKDAMIAAFQSQLETAEAAAQIAKKQTEAAIAEKEEAQATIEKASQEAKSARDENELKQGALEKAHTETSEAARALAEAMARAAGLQTQLTMSSIGSDQKDREITRLQNEIDLLTGDNEFVNELIKDAEKIPHSQIQTVESIQPIIMKALERLSKEHDPEKRHKIIKPFLTLIVKLLDAGNKKRRGSVRDMATSYNEGAKHRIAEQEELEKQPQHKSFKNLGRYVEKHGSKKNFGNVALNEMSGGRLLKYCYEIANNKVCDTPFSLIEEFENASKQDVKKTAYEQFLFESFLEAVLSENFASNPMKEFYMEARQILDKKHIYETTKMFFGILEICDAIRKNDRNADVIRLKTSEFDAAFDSFEQKVKHADYDFATSASKEIPSTISISFSEDHIYFYMNTNSFAHTYSINSSFHIDEEHYDFNNELYYVNDSMIFLFFVIANYSYMKDTFTSEIGDALAKYERTSKRKKKIKTKSIKKLLQQRIDGK